MSAVTPGTVFAGYRIDAIAGRGGMGVVFRARQERPSRTVALKVIAPGLGDDPELRVRFEREAELAAAIEHPNVLPVYEVGEHLGQLYIATRYIDGEDLRALIARERGIDPGRAAGIAAQVGAALDAAHARGLVHRDVKPANVLLVADAHGEHAYLTDFGLTKLVGDGSVVSGGRILGTPSYMAPEQFSGGSVDARADVYALGCLLYEMLVDEVPYPSADLASAMHAHFTASPPSPSRTRAGVPAAFNHVVATALAKRSEDRYQSAGDLGRAALAAAQGRAYADPHTLVATGEAAPLRAPASASPRRPRAPLVAAVVGSLLGVAAIAAVVLAVTLIGHGRDGGDGAAPRSADTLIHLDPVAPGIGPARLGLRKAEVDRRAGKGTPVRDPASGAFRFRYRAGSGDVDVVYQRTPGDSEVTVPDPDPSGVIVAGVATSSPVLRLRTRERSLDVGLGVGEIRAALVPAQPGPDDWKERTCTGFVEIVKIAPFSARQLWRAAWRYPAGRETGVFEMALLPSVVGGEGERECLVVAE